MAVKTITIDLEAYEVLSRYKTPGKSFSEVIKDELGRRRTGRDLRRIVERLRMSEDALDAIEAQIKARRRHPAKAPKL
ncbi:MAG TPA: antitoxin VapB family protein [Vicinamibacteria bacterium]|nr:antitoxin VapB family protein [Vicinamibacteria bacterium]